MTNTLHALIDLTLTNANVSELAGYQRSHDPYLATRFIDILVDLSLAERDVLIAELRSIRDRMRRQASTSAVVWLDLAIVQLSVDRWKELSELFDEDRATERLAASR